MGLLTAGAATLFYCEQKDDEPILCINEVCGYNFSIASDEEGNYSDYIEICNLSDEDIYTDYYLSDSKKDLKKIKLETPIAPREHRVIWLSGDEAPFNIDKNGETVYLSTEGGRVVDAVAVPLLPYNVSFSREKDGTGDFETLTGTPGETNDEALFVETEHINEPEFSIDDGFYEEGTKLKLSAGLFDNVYYTDDGSEPTENSKKYRAPITLSAASSKDNIYANEIMYPIYEAPNYKIDKANVIKAIAVNKITGKKSSVVSHVYFVGFENKPHYKDVEIMSLVTDPGNLFDHDRGIYTLGKKYDEYKKLGGFENLPDDEIPPSFVDENGEEVHRLEYTNSSYMGREWERPATMTMFDKDRKISDKKDIGIRIAGESTRFVFQKSLNLFVRDVYSDEGSFSCGFYDGEKKMRLRKGDGRIVFQEAFLHSVLDNVGIANNASRPCVLFLNGEYWGIYTLREQYDEEYFANHMGITPEDLYVVKNNVAEFGGEIAEGDHHRSIEELVYYDLTDPKQYSLVESSINIDNMIDYFCALLFFNDEDIDPDHNQLLYKEKGGKWNWAAYDLDVTCSDPTFDTISYYRDKGENMFLPGCMYEREGFKEQFKEEMNRLLENELSYDNLHEQLMEYDHIYRKQNIETIRRFENPDYSEADYEKDLSELDDFLKERGAYISEYLEEDFVLY